MGNLLTNWTNSNLFREQLRAVREFMELSQAKPVKRPVNTFRKALDVGRDGFHGPYPGKGYWEGRPPCDLGGLLEPPSLYFM